LTVIGVTGIGSLFGQAIIKSIKKSSFNRSKLIGVDYFNNTVGSFWTDKNYILPDILNKNIKEKKWLEKVIDIINLEKINILFLGVDFELKIFSKNKKFIESQTNCFIVVSNLDVINIGNDKYLTYKFLKKNLLNHPKTYLEHEIDFAIKELGFPLILKPRIGYRSINVFTIYDEKELRIKIKNIKKPIIQEYIGNKNTEYTCGTISFNDKLKKSIALRRDLKDGHTITTYLDKNVSSTILNYINDVSSALTGQVGVCNFQLRISEKGLPKVFEINPRHSGTTFIRSLYGYNEVEYILEYLLNKKEIQFKLRHGIVKRYFEEFFVG
jgi:carbamoyl-phosphate synthase large subunit